MDFDLETRVCASQFKMNIAGLSNGHRNGTGSGEIGWVADVLLRKALSYRVIDMDSAGYIYRSRQYNPPKRGAFNVDLAMLVPLTSQLDKVDEKVNGNVVE